MRLLCFISGFNVFPVNTDEGSIVAELKEKIMEKNTKTLVDIDAHMLTLYRGEVDGSLSLRERMDALNLLSQRSSACIRLVEDDVTTYFSQRPLEPREYYVIVVIPEGELIYCGGVPVWLAVIDHAGTDLREGQRMPISTEITPAHKKVSWWYSD